MNQDKFRLWIIILFAATLVTVWVGMLFNITARSRTMHGFRTMPHMRQPMIPSGSFQRKNMPQRRMPIKPYVPPEKAPTEQK